MKRGRLIPCLLIGLAAPFLLLQGLANAEIAPAPVSWNGFWQAKLALNFLQVEQEDNELTLSVGEGGKGAALSAFAKEPLASDALFLLAADYRAAGNTAVVDELLNTAAVLDKRNRNLGAMQLEQAAIAGNTLEVFAILDRLAITSPQLISEFVQPLALMLEDENSLGLLREALEREPAWGEAFWGNMPATEQGVANIYALRRATDAGTTPNTDAALLSALLKAKRFDDASDFWNEISGDAANPMVFVSTDELPPIGWQTISTGERSFLRDGANKFEIYVAEQTFGELARQVVNLEPGSYSFSATILPESEAASIEATLTCLTGDGVSFAPQALDQTAEWAVDDRCRMYWLILSGSAWQQRSALRASIGDMQFQRVN